MSVQENLWDLAVKFVVMLAVILILMFLRTAYNVYHIPNQLRKVQESLEQAIAKHQEKLKENQENELVDKEVKLNNVDDESNNEKHKDL